MLINFLEVIKKLQLLKLMKFIFFICLNSFLIFNPSVAETNINKSEILKKSNECLKDPHRNVCKKLIFQMEQIQLLEFEQNRFRCQSSILGLQTELVEAYFLKKIPKGFNGIMIPYVIKNC